MTRDPEFEDLLHAYVDDQLTQAQRRDVEVRLADDPEAARRVAIWSQQNADLRDLIPEASASRMDRILARAQRGQTRSFEPARIAALLATLAIGLAGGYGVARVQSQADLTAMAQVAERAIAQAAAAHELYSVEVRHPVEVRADTDKEHLFNWLTKRMGTRVMAPDMQAQGYTLIGGRLLPFDGGPAAQYMYETVSGARVTLYIARADMADTTPLTYGTQGDLTVIAWQDGPLQYVLTGSMDRAVLEPLAVALHDELI